VGRLLNVIRVPGVVALLLGALLGIGPAWAQTVQVTGGVPVLMYHRVDRQLSALDPLTVGLTVMTPAFEAQLQRLQAAGYRSTTLAALREALDRRAPLPAHQVVLTFDDGYADHYSTVFPLLQRYGFAATFFVVTSSVGTRDHLTVPQIREMAQAGMDIESHGVHHVDFSHLSIDDARRELLQSRKTLEGWTERPVTFFAYPAGRYSAGLTRLLDTLGYRGALTTQPGFVTLTSQPFTLERVRITHDDTAISFARKLGLPAR
jgi:peptidoglycan/xylan/chitin deacetylase (PgdA/CDA1 family)